MRPATVQDRPAIENLLNARRATSMFPLSNLRHYGMEGGHHLAMNFWLREKSAEITDILGITEAGMVMPQCPTAPWSEVAAILRGRTIIGVIGDGSQVAGIKESVPLPQHDGIDAVEPRYGLMLDAMQMPDGAGLTLVQVKDAPRDLMEAWRAAYIEEAMPLPGQDYVATARSDIASYIARDSHRVLYRDGVPVSFTGFNATLPDIVQIGGVWTPPELRCQGLARKAVALHLAEAAISGVKEAVLFAASPQAARAYEAIGFQRDGDFAFYLYPKPQVIDG